jgi:hypothetical protein
MARSVDGLGHDVALRACDRRRQAVRRDQVRCVRPDADAVDRRAAEHVARRRR